MRQRKEERGKRKEETVSTREGGAVRAIFFSALFSLLFPLLLSACGFHLRGTGDRGLPPELSALRVVVPGDPTAYNPLAIAMERALQDQAGVPIEPAGDVPRLELGRERLETRVLSVGSTARAAEYLLQYEVDYRVVRPDGSELVPPQTVRLQRDFGFDPENVLAKEREELELREAMRRDAVQQIVRRLTRASFE
jgi:LPS-assembly lipoprotein